MFQSDDNVMSGVHVITIFTTSTFDQQSLDILFKLCIYCIYIASCIFYLLL